MLDPPFPNIKADFLFSINGRILFSNPKISVLYPNILFFSIFIVFTDPTSLAVMSILSKQLIILFLYGMVTFKPHNFSIFINS